MAASASAGVGEAGEVRLATLHALEAGPEARGRQVCQVLGEGDALEAFLSLGQRGIRFWRKLQHPKPTRNESKGLSNCVR